MYSEIINRVHAEFNAASGELLLEAKKNNNISKADRLKKIGATSAASIAEYDAGDIRLAEYYSIHYPNNKFIKEFQVKAICKKYDLVYGAIALFKGFVPEKKLSDIENFKVRKEDIVTSYSHKWSRRSDWEFAESEKPSCFTKFLLRFFNPLPENLFTFYHWRKDANPLIICAPQKDMKTDRWVIIDNKMVPDPVVLATVKGGYLIVTAWGDEASDELVVNGKMN